MIARLDNPGKPSKEMSVSYNNKGSVARLKNYLIQNTDKYDSADLFFTATKNNITADDFYKLIDNNVKGLEKNEHKFYSFTLNPSSEEVQFIASAKEKLKGFVRSAMADFHTAHKTLEKSDDLVWAAIIHDNRVMTEADIKKYKDKGKTELKIGDIKPGDNIHVHVVLSARDATQKKTITVLSPKNKISRNFELTSFQRNSQRLFQEKFSYQKGVDIYGEVQQNYIKKKVDQLDKTLYKSYDSNDIIQVGKKMDWESKFAINHSNLLRETQIENQIILQPKIYLEHGRKYYNANVPNGKVAAYNFESTYVFKDNTNAYKSATKIFVDFCRSFETEGKRQETKGYDLVATPRRKSNRKLKRKEGFDPGFRM